MHGSLDPSEVGKKFERGMVAVRHAGDVDIDVIEQMAQRTGNWLLGSPEIYGVKVVGHDDISLIQQRTQLEQTALLGAVDEVAQGLFKGIDEARVDRIKVVARSSVFHYLRIGLDNELLPHFDNERRLLYGEFGLVDEFRPKKTFPYAIVPVRRQADLENVRGELIETFGGGVVALKGAEVEII